jgi:hypothetical protein
MNNNAKEEWKEYYLHELAGIASMLSEFDIVLDEYQPHVLGERYLMQAVTTESGKKLILLGSLKETGQRVVIKATSDESGKRELTHERKCRSVINTMRFSYNAFNTPKEIIFLERNGYVISVQQYIEQDIPFIERPLEKQFSFALASFKSQEGAHATTYEHIRLITQTFGNKDTSYYLDTFAGFKETVVPVFSEHAALFTSAEMLLSDTRETVEQYNRFLTHTDFVPHNFRIHKNELYLLDYSSIRFGNKYEGWARFMNFMTLYNQDLERVLVRYVQDNRTPEESVSLKSMRVYRLGEILSYYVRTLKESSGNLLLLNTARIQFWSKALAAILNDDHLAEAIVSEYTMTRDSLRSEEEKQRQIVLH